MASRATLVAGATAALLLAAWTVAAPLYSPPRAQLEQVSPRFQRQMLVMQASAVASGALDEGLPTLSDDTIWDAGSPQNAGWSNGDYSTGTGTIKDTQYSWWQRHLVPDEDFQKTMNRLQATEPSYDAHGNEQEVGAGEGDGVGNPMSFRGPGFYRMSP